MDWSFGYLLVCTELPLNSYANPYCLTRFWFLERIANCHGKESIKQVVEELFLQAAQAISEPRRANDMDESGNRKAEFQFSAFIIHLSKPMRLFQQSAK
jgi:hypothetical protein